MDNEPCPGPGSPQHHFNVAFGGIYTCIIILLVGAVTSRWQYVTVIVLAAHIIATFSISWNATKDLDA